MYKLLIVDDEEIIRRGLTVMVGNLGFEFAAIVEAENGVKAMEAIETLNPEIIITDIKMPHMDGLQLLKTIRDRNLKSRVILLTSYGEFDYAKKAVSYKALEYLLKPIKPQELEKALRNAVEDIEKENEREKLITHQSKLLQNTISDLTEKKLKEILDGRIKRKDTFSKFLELESIPMEQKYFSLLYGRISNQGAVGYPYITFEWQDYIKSVVGSKYGSSLVFEDTQDSITAIINYGYEHDRQDMEEIATRINSFLIQKGMKISWGVSSRSEEANDVPRLNVEAKNAIKEKILYGTGKIFFYENLKPGIDFTFNASDILTVLSLLESKDKDRLFEFIRNKFDEPVKRRAIRGKIFENALYSLMLNIVSRTRGIESADSFMNNDMQHFSEQLSLHSNIYDAIRLFVDTLFSMTSNHANPEKQAHSKKAVDLVKYFIQQNYFKDINLDMIANQVSMNPSYFSVLFKKETGLSLVDYINDIRISKAMEYLSDPQYKVYEISAKVGFSDEKYFCKVFKKKVGKSPSQYRESSLI